MAQRLDRINRLLDGITRNRREITTPEGITLATLSQTEIVVQGADKQRVGEVAAKIRGFRPPEPYKGKGVKYSDEVIIRKEAKKA